MLLRRWIMGRKRNRRNKHRNHQRSKQPLNKLDKYKEKQERKKLLNNAHKKTTEVVKTTVVSDPDKGCKKKSRTNTDKCWSSNLHVSKDNKCPHIEDPETDIIIPYSLWQKIMGLTCDISTEWLGYLGASRLTDGKWKAIDIKIPPQEVTGSNVKPTDTIHSEGVIHSHVSMGAFFSGTDDDYLNENHDFSIVVNKRGETKAVLRHKLPCGSMTLIDAKVVVEMPEAPDVSAFITSAKENITEHTYVSSYQNVKNKKTRCGFLGKTQKIINKHRDRNNKAWTLDDDDDNKDTGVPGYNSDQLQSHMAADQESMYEYMDYGDIYGCT